MRFAVIVAAALVAAACSSTNTIDYRNSSHEMSDDLVSQLDARVDTRQMRLVVDHFQTSGHALRTTVRNGRVYYDTTPYEDIPERFRNQLISDLAQRVRVVEKPPASNKDATAVLMGNVNFGDNESIIIQTRILDSRTHEILATSTAVIK